MNLFVDISVLQSVPPSNLNRDDTGSPKTATYGGATRARVSSQAWKRATRKHFAEYLDASQVGVRTRRLGELLAEQIQARDSSLDAAAAEALAWEVLGALALKSPKKKGDEAARTEYLLFVSHLQITRLAELALEQAGALNKRQLKAAINSDNSFDVALFGRMVADDAELNVDAAAQVAHAISTHAISTEFDYFTAVDDENPSGETGAGMIGMVEFDSATLYRYATVHVPGLLENLGDPLAAVRATQAFVRSFVLSMPTGKVNTFANWTNPEAVVVSLRADRPVNHVGAFERPLPASGEGFVAGSARALARYITEVEQSFAAPPARRWVSRVGETAAALDDLAAPVPFEELVTQLGAEVEARLQAS